MKKEKKNRRNYNVSGERSARSVSVKSAEREKQAWIIVSSLGKNQIESEQVIRYYGLRMQIEESFRDLKSHRYGMGLEDSRSQGIVHLTNLLLIGFVTSFMFWLIGICAKQKKMQYGFQANSIRNRDVLSIVFLAKEVVIHNKHRFRKYEWELAFFHLQGLIKCA